MILKIHNPAFPLNQFVDNFVYFEGFSPEHKIDRFLPDGNTEIIIDFNDTEKREFAAINIKPKELRIGFDLGDRAFDETVSKSKLSGPMPRISHMLVLTDKSQLNPDLVELLKASHQRSH